MSRTRVALLSCLLLGAACADRIVTLDRTVLDDVATMVRGSNGLVVTTVMGEVFKGDQLRRVVFNDEFQQPLSGPYLFAHFNGDRLSGNLVESDKGQLTLRVRGLGVIEIPLFDLRAIVVVEAMTEDPILYLKQTENEKARLSDQIVLRSGTAYDEVLIDGIDPERIRFEINDDLESIGLSQIRSVLIAEIQPHEAAQGSSVVRVTLVDGTRVTGTLESYVSGTLTLSQVYGKRLMLDRDQIREIEFRNPSVRYISELSAEEIVHRQALIELAFPPRFDLNCMNPPGPLSLDGQIYDVGIGMHTYTSMSFDISELKASRLLGLVGLNDQAREAAMNHPSFPSPAKIQVYLDGQPVFEEPVALNVEGRATVLDIPLAGVGKLRLETDFNETYDMLGRVDWADLYLLVGP